MTSKPTAVDKDSYSSNGSSSDDDDDDDEDPRIAAMFLPVAGGTTENNNASTRTSTETCPRSSRRRRLQLCESAIGDCFQRALQSHNNQTHVLASRGGVWKAPALFVVEQPPHEGDVLLLGDWKPASLPLPLRFFKPVCQLECY